MFLSGLDSVNSRYSRHARGRGVALSRVKTIKLSLWYLTSVRNSVACQQAHVEAQACAASQRARNRNREVPLHQPPRHWRLFAASPTNPKGESYAL